MFNKVGIFKVVSSLTSNWFHSIDDRNPLLSRIKNFWYTHHNVLKVYSPKVIKVANESGTICCGKTVVHPSSNRRGA